MKRIQLVLAAVICTLVASVASAQEKVTLRLDWVNSGYHAIWYYGIDKGIFKKEGVDLEVLEGRGSAATAQTVANGSVMFGTSDSGAVMGLISQGLPIKIVGGYLRKNPMALIFPKKNGWKSFEDVGRANARIGYATGSASALLLPPTLKAAGIEGKVRLINMAPAAKPTSLLEGKVDAIESFDFLQVPLLEASGMPSDTLPFWKAGIDVPGLSLITSNDMIQKNPALVRKMVDLMQQTLQMSRQDPNGAIDSLLKRAPTLKREVVTQVLTLSFNLLETDATKGQALAYMPPEVIRKSQDILHEYGGIKQKRPIEAYFTNEFVPGAK